MNIVLLGAPGSGKGTQAANIIKDFDIIHISTGDIFRKNIKENTPLGVKAKQYINEGKLVPDELVIEIVTDRIKQDDCKNGFMLDGFPRTEFQAIELNKITNIDAVINLNIETKELISRISGRRVCEKCSATKSVDLIKMTEKCTCGGNYIQREDDKIETVKKRIDVYESQTKPLINYYKSKGKLIDIEGAKTIREVYKDIKNALISLNK